MSVDVLDLWRILLPRLPCLLTYRLWDDGLGARRMDSFKLSTRALAVNYLKDYKFQSEGAAALVERTGLRKLLDCSIQHLDGPLLVAFGERWQPDTNTFHMPFGEMTITLHDVAVLLGIPVGEDMVVGNESVKAQLCEMLRVEQLNERSKPSLKSGGLVCVEAMQQVGRFRERDSEVRMFLTCLLGTTLFVDRSGIGRRAGSYEYFPCLRDQKLGTRGLVCGEPFAKKWEGVRIGVDVCRSANVKMYSLSYGPGLSELWKAPHCHSVQLDSISRPVQKPEDTEDGYLQWYMGRTHPRIVCPSAADQEIHHHLSHDQLVREFRTVIEHPYDDHLDLLLGLQGLLKEYDEATPYQPPPQY
ncbi:unnamed protein product [Linum tenue]|uniref:Aminotransferase-like plant mobile domain-containing protein n=1 Tax=Linum tenue TaxID=586396 RepID=A0AAV0I5R8_9ROSI|nr:unnamed protein product [Linum tenue]